MKLQPISVVFTTPEENIGQINSALAAGTVPVLALSSDGTKVLAKGHLALVDNQVDQTSGTIRMKATFQNTDNALWPGLSVATRLLVDTKKNVLVAPNDAIQRGPNGLFAFVVGKDNKVAARDIKVGDEGSAQTVVLEGLANGDRVVTAGQYRLTEGAVVDPHTANTPSSVDKQAANTPRKVQDYGRRNLGAIYPATDCHLVADGGRPVCWPCCLSASTSGATAASGLSDNSGFRKPARGKCRYDGIGGGPAAGHAVRANSRRCANDVDQRRRRNRDYNPV